MKKMIFKNNILLTLECFKNTPTFFIEDAESTIEELKDFFAYYDNDIIIDNLEYFLYLGEDIVKIMVKLVIMIVH